MQNSQFRCLVLAAVLGAGYALAVSVSPAESAAPRAPTDAGVYRVEGWATSRPTVETAWGIQSSSRRYGRPDGTIAGLTVRTSPEAKHIYKSGSELPYLGAGYTVEAPPPGLIAPGARYDAFLARREGELNLVFHAFGERRGLMGNGPLAWGLAGVDGVLGQANDYYQLSLVVPLDRPDAPRGGAVAELAATLFPRLASWYSQAPSLSELDLQ
jgi:hypothetical protein